MIAPTCDTSGQYRENRVPMDQSDPRQFNPVNRTFNITPPATTPATPAGLISTVKPAVIVLTPPTSPGQVRFSSDQSRQESVESSLPEIEGKDEQVSSRSVGGALSLPQGSVDKCLRCPFDVKILSDPCGGNQVFGSGVWSTVYKAIRQPTSFSSALVTPPTSPVAPSITLLAIKVPMRKDAETILEHEGEILTYISQLTGAENFVPPFFGLIPKFTALVLGAIPLSLEEHILTCAVDSKQKLSTRGMNDPVVGSSRVWLDLAHKVITALHWLHDEASVVHGDIKPGNILLRPNSHGPETSQFPFRPMLIDFSSSHLMHNGTTNPHSLSAVTREYTAPELLSSAVLRDPKSTATRPSDVFSTAVTLLVAATGDIKVYSGSVFQRQAMATQGWQILQLVRSGHHGSRVPPFGAVERTLERAVLKAGMGRLAARQWVDVVEEMMEEEPAKVF